MNKYCIGLFVLLVTNFTSFAQQEPAFLTGYNQIWVDSVFRTLSLDQKIGQLLMPRGNYSGKPHDEAKLEQWIRDYKIGGVVFFATNPTKQAELTNRLQSISKVPLLIGQDLEWGLSMRLDSTDRFPYAMAIGAIKGHNDYIMAMGQEIGRQCKRIGVHVNYAPVVDVNINPLNPVINFRSYGADKYSVALKATVFMQGMQKERLLCTAKHFPGHGDTNVDSHKDLPVIAHDRKRLDDIELYPFKALIKNGLSGIMTAHLNIPALEPQANLASTFSTGIITDLLKKELDFKGLVFTDAMEMEGAVKNFPKGEAFVRALQAGNDIIETFMDVPLAVAEIKKAISDGRIPMATVDAKVKKMLKAKSWVGLDKYKPIEMKGLITDLNTKNADVLNYKLASKIITCLKNEKDILPIRDLDKKFAIISLEGDNENEFVRMVSNYVKADVYKIPALAKSNMVDSIITKAKNYDHVIIGIQFNDIRPSRKYGLTEDNISHIKRLISIPNAIVTVMASPFIMQNIKEFSQCHTLVMGYQKSKHVESVIAQAIFGAEDIVGFLPMTINSDFESNRSVNVKSLGRLRYGPPEIVGIDRVTLRKNIDNVINEGIDQRAYPGCVFQVSKDGVVIDQKSYGYLTYTAINNSQNTTRSWAKIDDAMDNFDAPATIKGSEEWTAGSIGKTNQFTLYDLASITKIAASTLAVMQLTSEGKIDINKTLGEYVPSARGTNKASLKLKDMLTHRAGLQAWIPFWRHGIDTAATVAFAIEKGNIPKDSLVYGTKKPSFFGRLFGRKSKTFIDSKTTVNQHPVLWNKILSTSPISWKANTFSKTRSDIFSIEIAPDLFSHRDFPNRIKKMILDSPLSDTSTHKYVYSDLHYYFYPEIIQNITGKPMEAYLSETYSNIGAHSFTYNPKSNPKNIAPTEIDSMFRKGLIHTKVHDEGAALMAGISGHAGLFGNANDLHTLMYMYLKNGTYAGIQYIKPEVISEFTRYQFPAERNRRGIGFDKKDFDSSVVNGPSLASDESFGHSGFTGTYTWVDPKHNLVYVFLSNRVFPTRDNGLINSLKIRQRLGDAIIKSFDTYDLGD